MSKETKDWARRQAARLQRFLKKQDIELPLKQCQEAVAAMNGVQDWRTFERSSDADIVVHDPDALLPIADTVLQATLFEQLPHGVTLHSLCDGLAQAAAAEEAGEDWRTQTARMGALWDGVRERNLSVPPIQLPRVIQETRIAIVQALLNELLRRPATQAPQQEIYRQTLRDWRLEEGDTEIPVTDRRTYEARLEVGTSSCEMRCAYPHEDLARLPEGSPQLSARLEIREGLPCIGLYSDLYAGEELACVYGARNGEMVIRIDSEEHRVRTPGSHPLQKKLGNELLILKQG